jgi:hypothetical protein
VYELVEILLTSTNLFLHLMTLVFVGKQWLYPLPVPMFRASWGLLFFAMLCILPFRIADLIDPHLTWRSVLAFPMTVCFFASFWVRVSLYQWYLARHPLDQTKGSDTWS